MTQISDRDRARLHVELRRAVAAFDGKTNVQTPRRTATIDAIKAAGENFGTGSHTTGGTTTTTTASALPETIALGTTDGMIVAEMISLAASAVETTTPSPRVEIGRKRRSMKGIQNHERRRKLQQRYRLAKK
jgi:hypothetical protein